MQRFRRSGRAATPSIVVAAALSVVVVTGCSDPYRSKRIEAQDFIEESMPIGTARESVLRVLRVREVPFSLIQRADCAGFVRGPTFECRGGSAIVITHEKLRSMRSPFYSPYLRSFLAFDAEERLADYVIFEDGRD